MCKRSYSMGIGKSGSNGSSVNKGSTQVAGVDGGSIVVGSLNGRGGGGSLFLIGVTAGPAGHGGAEGVHAAGFLDLGLVALDFDFNLFRDILVLDGLNGRLKK